MSLAIAALLLIASSWLVWRLSYSKSSVAIHLALLSLTPWFVTLVLAQPPLSPPKSYLSDYERIATNLAYLTSDDFLFFIGDGREGFGTLDHGVFLLSFLPLILMGVYQDLISQQKNNKLPLWWLVGGLTIAILFGHVSGLPAALWFLPALSVLATQGLIFASRLAVGKKTSLAVRLLILVLGLWLVYEAALLHHFITIHQPVGFS